MNWFSRKATRPVVPVYEGALAPAAAKELASCLDEADLLQERLEAMANAVGINNANTPYISLRAHLALAKTLYRNAAALKGGNVQRDAEELLKECTRYVETKLATARKWLKERGVKVAR